MPKTSVDQPDQPVEQVTLRRRKLGLTGIDRTKTAGGYTLYARQTGCGEVDLIDIEGRKVHRWDMPVRPGRDAVILPNGNRGYNGSHSTSADLYPAWDLWHGGDFMEVTPDGEVVWRHEDIFHHHDGAWLPNGNLLYTIAAPLPKDKAARVTGGDPRKDGADSVVQSDIVREVNRAGEVVWEWINPFVNNRRNGNVALGFYRAHRYPADHRSGRCPGWPDARS